MSHTITAACIGCTACARICPVQAISGERKQQHQIDAARCVDCGACGRICPVDAVLDPQGQPVQHIQRKLWPKPVVALRECLCCGACLQACPVACLDWGAPDPKSHRAYPRLADPGACIACGFCARACPVEAVYLTISP